MKKYIYIIFAALVTHITSAQNITNTLNILEEECLGEPVITKVTNEKLSTPPPTITVMDSDGETRRMCVYRYTSRKYRQFRIC